MGLTGPMPVPTTPRGDLLAVGRGSSSASASVPSFADVYGIRAAGGRRARPRRVANPGVTTSAIQRMKELYVRQSGGVRTGDGVKRKYPDADAVTGLRAPRGKKQDTRQATGASTQYFSTATPR